MLLVAADHLEATALLMRAADVIFQEEQLGLVDAEHWASNSLRIGSQRSCKTNNVKVFRQSMTFTAAGTGVLVSLVIMIEVGLSAAINCYQLTTCR